MLTNRFNPHRHKVPTHFNRTQLIHTMYLHFSFSQYKQISFLNYTAFKMQVQHFVKHTRRTKTGFWIAFAATTTFFNSTHFTIQRTTVFCNVLILLILCNFNKHKRVRRHRNMEERLKYNLICFFFAFSYSYRVVFLSLNTYYRVHIKL